MYTQNMQLMLFQYFRLICPICLIRQSLATCIELFLFSNLPYLVFPNSHHGMCYQREQNKSVVLGNQLDNLTICLYFLNGFKCVKSYQGYAFGKVANKEKQENQYKLECLKVYNCASGGQWIVEGQAMYICSCCYCCKRSKFFGLAFVSRTRLFWKTAITTFSLTKRV